MVSRLSLTRFLNGELDIKNIEDQSRNGMQVRCSDNFKKIGLAVDASLETFKLAKKERCDLIIVHHGLFWKFQKNDECNLLKKRVDYLKKNKISLYACHLPLDLHSKYGNNIKLAELFNLTNIKSFGNYHGVEIGYSGYFDKAVDMKEFEKKINRKLKTKSIVLNFGKNKIKTMGIVSGGGSGSLGEAYLRKLDCLLIGEAPHHIYHEAKEFKVNLILGGHYQTETLGVMAIGELLKEKYGTEVKFLNVPTLI